MKVCDGVILHAATPAQLAPIVDACRAVRPMGRLIILQPAQLLPDLVKKMQARLEVVITCAHPATHTQLEELQPRSPQ